MSRGKQLATFGAGCFWEVQKAFSETEGVLDTTAGFMGGKEKDPTYNEVGSGDTGHTEVVQVVYNPNVITYDELLEVFWGLHDPIEEKKEQYRSTIFYYTEDQRSEAVQSKIARAKKIDEDLVTNIVPAMTFYPASKKHQDYLEKKK